VKHVKACTACDRQTFQRRNSVALYQLLMRWTQAPQNAWDTYTYKISAYHNFLGFLCDLAGLVRHGFVSRKFPIHQYLIVPNPSSRFHACHSTVAGQGRSESSVARQSPRSREILSCRSALGMLDFDRVAPVRVIHLSIINA
jgi:hypothetical protein